MAFYTSIASQYDAIFPPSSARLAFVKAWLPDRPARVLDLGCATGKVANALTEAGHWVIGVDLDPALVARASQEAADLGLATTFLVRDMLDIVGLVPEGNLDCVTCFGNTLVHLESTDRIALLCERVRGVLADTGVFLGQVINYDRILGEGAEGLSTIDNDAVRFERRYRRRDEDRRIVFSTTLTVKDTGQVMENEILLFPASRADLDRCLDEAGFGRVDYFAAYDRSPWSPSAGPTIFAARL